MIDRDNVRAMQLRVIGTLLRRPELIGDAASALTTEDFGGEAEGTIFKAIVDLFFADKPVDVLTVRHVVGPEYEPVFRDALDAPPLAPEEAKYYFDLLAEYSRLIEMQFVSAQLQASRNMDEARTYVDKLNELCCARRKARPVSAAELIARYLKRKSEGAPPPEYVSFGMPALDDALFVRPGDVVVLGGYASAGKTLLALQFALHMAQRYNVGFFSLETDEDKLGERLIARYAQIDFRAIKRGTETKDDLKRAMELGVEIGDYKGRLDFIRVPGLSVRDIQSLTLSQRYQVIFVDYLQIVSASGRDMRERISNVSMSLHTMAQTHGVTVVELAQLVRPEKTKGKAAPPDMWSFKESGQIENDADVAMLLYPTDLDDNASPRILKVSKNKDGSKLRLTLDFDGAHQSLTPAPQDYAESSNAVFAASAAAVRARRQQEPPEQVKMYDLYRPDPDCPF